jgi:serine/threonine protein kinase
MVNDRSSRVREIFDQAAEIAVASDRLTFLDTACAGDDELRHQVDALLKAYNDAGSFLDRPALEVAAAGKSDQTEAFDSTPAPAGAGEATKAESAARRDDDSLSFLAPAFKPGHLGRLGHYEIQEVIGKGAFGTVLRAFDEKLHRVVAIKVLSSAYAANGAARKRFTREAQNAAAVKNDHVVAIHAVDDEAQPPYLVMEIIDGFSLQDKIEKKGPLSVKEILRIGMQTAEGLAAAHKQGLVHRDIKPANILLENGVERVKITDFGLARAVDDASVTQSGTVAGTPLYMSPEQAEGLQIDHRSDLFSLGTVLYAMCTGHPPFRASGTHAVLKRVIDASPRPIREINNEIPDWLCAIIAKLHAKKPEDRFQKATEVAELLGQHLAHLQQPTMVARPAPVSLGAAEP